MSTKRSVAQAVDSLGPRLQSISAQIHANPELGFEEVKAAAWLTEALVSEGFQVERGVGDLPTAFRATYRGGPGPTVAILCEYDALAGIGHACGHNLIGTAGLGAGLALKRAWPDLPGTLQVIGCPAEEGGGGKVYLVERGVFDGVDAAMMFHPGDHTISWRDGLATNRVTFRFHGKKAHVARPWDGINALDAMIQLFVSANLMRQHFQDGSRLSGIISKGGDAANIVPDLTEAHFSVRAKLSSDHRAMVEELVAAAEAAAKSHRCTMDWEQGPTYAARVNNMVICRAWEENVAALGEPVEQPGPDWVPGSSDIGNVSLVCPTIHPYIQLVPPGTAGHSPEIKAAAGGVEGQRVLLLAAKSLAMTAWDLFASPDLMKAARAEFDAAAK